MDLEEVDRLCDIYEERRKSGDRLSVQEFIKEQGVDPVPGLIENLQPLAEEYDTSLDFDAPTEDEFQTRVLADQGRPKIQYTGPRIGEHQVLQKLGQGGMGVVYKARHMSLGRLVAIKMVLAGRHAPEKLVRRFRDEAESAARLNHPNIVAVYDVGQHDGMPYFTTEFIDGQPLSAMLRESPLGAKGAAELMEPLARATHYSHERGIVHRDLKPLNILITRDGTPKIADFGLAKRLDNSGSDQTETGAVVGTPGFMAPEQARAEKEIGPGVDIYALGAVLYAMLTGSAPFRAPTPHETISLVVKEPPVPPSRIQPQLNKDIETICLKCLHKDVDRRYSSAEALADDLKRFQEGRPIEARPISRAERVWMWCKREPKDAALVAMAVSLLLALLIGGFAAAAVFRTQRNEIAAKNEQVEEREELANETMRTALYDINQFFVDNPQMSSLNEKLLEDLRRRISENYQGVSDEKVRGVFHASVIRQLGELYALSGMHEEAIKNYLESEAIAKKLHDRGELTDPNMNFATLDRYIGQSLLQLKKQVDAENRFRSMIENREAYHRTQPQLRSAKRQADLAEAYTLLAVSLKDQRKLGEAEKWFDRALDNYRKAYAAEPNYDKRKEELAGSLEYASGLYERQGRLDKMVNAKREQIQLLREVVESNPSFRQRANLAMALGKYGKRLLISRDPEHARVQLDEAVSIFERLLMYEEVPNTVLENAAAANNWLGIALQRTGNDAGEHPRRAVEIYDRLVQELPHVKRYKNDRVLALARSPNHREEALQEAKRLSESEAWFDWGYSGFGYGLVALRETDPAKRASRTQESIEQLRRFVRAGFHDFKSARGETDLDFADLMKLDGYAEMIDEEESRLQQSP